MSLPKLKMPKFPGFLQRGEHLVAMSGLGAAALILTTIGAAGLWTLDSNEAARREGREQTLHASAQLLGAAGEQMLASGEITQLRTLVAGVAASHHFQSVRITMPDGTAIADSSPGAEFKKFDLPPKWSKTADFPDVPAVQSVGGRMHIAAPMDVPGRGPVLLEIEDAAPVTMWSDWRVQTGFGAIGAAGLVAMVGFYRAVRRRFRALGAIAESLAAVQAGESDPAVLCVARSFGPEAEAWNQLLAEREEMRAHMSQDKAELQLGNRRGATGREGDLFSLCDAMWQGLVLVDDRLKIKFVNGAGAVFLRGKREEMLSQDAARFITDQRVLDALKAFATGAGRGRAVVEVEQDKDPANAALRVGGAGTVLRFSIRPVRKEDNAAAIVVVEDITQQRVAEEARNAFVASATHELRTPLTNIRLYVDELLEDPEQDVTKRTTAMNVISQGVRRLERMVSDMLSVSQIEAGTLKLNKGDVRLEPIFEELRADFAEQARQKEIKIKFDLPPKWPQMEGDRDKIMMALHNLIGNAIKYTPAGGEVTVRASADGKNFSCDVVDNGIGIKDEEQPLVFEKFYRAKDKRIANVTGTGLGLAIAREVVRLHGGDIGLKSQIDKGSTFTMTLPAKAA